MYENIALLLTLICPLCSDLKFPCFSQVLHPLERLVFLELDNAKHYFHTDFCFFLYKLKHLKLEELVHMNF